ncbi:hypothetical protein [Aurantibacter sp.]|uniref:hypothetical protein n=1 Tax=Aurantibacter sp. TaxID=2807103 RepID=UPI0032660E18
MSNKIKSSLFLSCFIAVFTIYNFSITETEKIYSDSSEIVKAELEQIATIDNLDFEESK